MVIRPWELWWVHQLEYVMKGVCTCCLYTSLCAFLKANHFTLYMVYLVSVAHVLHALVLLYQRYGVYTTIAKVPVYPVSRPLSEK